MQRIYKLKGVIQPYAWGGTEFIPALTGIPHKGPAAEYWLGAHPLAPSRTEDGQRLDDLIRENKQHFLGINLSGYDSFPFLVKILDVYDMLSIQVHPNREQAKKGFEKEESLGIPLTAKNRNYKDPNEKEEMMAALSDFWLLHGFKNEEKMQSVFDIPELSFLSPVFSEGGYPALFTTIMEMEQAKVNEVLTPLAERVTLLDSRGELEEDDPDFWAAWALKTYFSGGDIDRGIFCIYLLNLVQVKKGEAIYQPPGLLHAYLSGQNIEVMTNSDNVLRAALTPKHIDVPELLKLVEFSPVEPIILRPAQDSGCFDTPSKNFQLSYYDEAPASMDVSAPLILVVTGGRLMIGTGRETRTFSRGEVALVVPGDAIHISSGGNVEFFTVTVPKKKS